MKRIFILTLFMFVSGLQAFAQSEYPRVEVTGGIAFQRSAGDNFPGWNASVAGNIRGGIGVVAEFAGIYQTKSGIKYSLYEYLFGPRINVRLKKATIFFHTLYGASNGRMAVSDFGLSRNFFSYTLGGGVDINAGKTVAVRVAQVDKFSWYSEGMSGTDFRYLAGIVFKLGGKKN